MAWTIEFHEAARKELERLDRPVAKRIASFLRNRLAQRDDLRSIGEAFKGAEWGDFWKYRVGDYRIIAAIEDQRRLILVVRIGNRREVYTR